MKVLRNLKMSEEDDWDRGFKTCYADLKPQIKRLEQENDALKELIRAISRVAAKT
jgi:hypothetical protein